MHWSLLGCPATILCVHGQLAPGRQPSPAVLVCPPPLLQNMLKINIEQATTYWVAPNCLSHLTYDEMVKYKLGILVDNAAEAGTAKRGGVLGVEPAPSDLDPSVDWTQLAW